MDPRAPIPTRGAVQIRPARPADAAALERFFDRCSPESRYQRFHGATGPTVRRELARITAGSPDHRSWVAVDARDGRTIRGTATLARGHDGEVEVAFLVEDGWTRHGVGRRLFGEMALHAEAEGLESLVARVQGGNERARRFLRTVAPGARTRFLGAGEFELDLPVAPAAQLARLAPVDALDVGASSHRRRAGFAGRRPVDGQVSA